MLNRFGLPCIGRDCWDNCGWRRTRLNQAAIDWSSRSG